MFVKILISIFISSIALAKSDPVGTALNGANSSQGNQAVVRTSTPSVNESANSAVKNNAMGAVVSQGVQVIMMGVATTFAMQCGFANPGACIKAAASFAISAAAGRQSSASRQAANYASQSASASDGYGYATNGFTDTEVGRAVGKAYNMNAFNSSHTKLTGSGSGLNGWHLNEDTGILTSPDGKNYNTNNMESVDGMTSSGIPRGVAESAFKDLDKASKDAQKKLGAYTPSSGFDEGGGGGGSKFGMGDGQYDANALNAAAAAGKDAGLAGRDPASSPFAGLSKSYNGEQIGVAQDSLFNMMTRRYKLKEKQDSFF